MGRKMKELMLHPIGATRLCSLKGGRSCVGYAFDSLPVLALPELLCPMKGLPGRDSLEERSDLYGPVRWKSSSMLETIGNRRPADPMSGNSMQYQDEIVRI